MQIDFFLLFKGMIIGFSIAAPVGPIGILCIRRTLAQNRLAGLISGLGAATADTVYGLIAGLGLTFISRFLINQQGILRLVGGLFLLYLGVKTFLQKTVVKEIQGIKQNLWQNYLSTFFLTLTNPITILSFISIFAGMGIANTDGNYLSALMLVLGVFIGSMLWWILLSSGASFFQNKISEKGLGWINKTSGVIIASFGIAAFGTLLF